MSTCDNSTPTFQREESTLDVSAKYKQLMQDSLSEESLYTRAKDTLFVLFNDLQLTEKEKAQVVAEHVASMTTQLSGSAMQVALSWEKEERDGAYTLAKVKAEAEKTMADALKSQEEICLLQKQTELQCANITATLSGSYRENGMPTGFDQDGCSPTGIDDTGLKYHQTRQVEAATYQSYADAYRKSGVVTVLTDPADSTIKGITSTTDYHGYTDQQTQNAERQRYSYEDSKANHLLNSLAVVQGQLLSADIAYDDNWKWMMDAMQEAAENLNSENPLTTNAFG